MALVVFRLKGDNDLNQRLLDDLNARGNTFIIHTKLDGVMVLRLAVGGIDASEEAVMDAWREISTRGKVIVEGGGV